MSDIKETFPTGEEAEEIAEPSAAEQIEAEKPKTKQTSVARSAGIVSIAVMFSRVLGLAREMIFANYFGAGFLYDAYQVGFYESRMFCAICLPKVHYPPLSLRFLPIIKLTKAKRKRGV